MNRQRGMSIFGFLVFIVLGFLVVSMVQSMWGPRYIEICPPGQPRASYELLDRDMRAKPAPEPKCEKRKL